MDSLYPVSQPYGFYEQHQWTEDSKSSFVGDDQNSTLDPKPLESGNMTHLPSGLVTRRSSVLKVEDEFTGNSTPTATSSSQMWHDRTHDHRPVRSFSSSHAPMMNGNGQSYMRVNDPTFTATIQHAHTWSVPHSGASTPTPLYGQVYDMPFAHVAPGFSGYSHDPISAVSMSPQSSQGGWASATSSDGMDQRGLISPTYPPPSPGSVVRPDGIRKKNARFEIPKERNLANIDAMILASTDDGEKKELKQQKRLLRNRQAALDSRQRKKTHTEKLEIEKKSSEKKMFDMEEALTRIESTLVLERDQFQQQRQHMENLIHALQYDRDEAIRTKTIETAELRRQNNMLKDCVRDLERQQHKGYAPASQINQYNNDFDGFDLDDSWDDEFGLIDGDDLKMDDSDALQRQATPRPTTSVAKPVDAKAEAGFSWSTFYMCLLFGAFIASNNNSSNADNKAASAIASSISSAEASNVLKIVLSSGKSGTDIISGGLKAPSTEAMGGPHHLRQAQVDPSIGPSSGLDHMHHSLSTPTRRQEMAAAFSMSASSYQHLTDPFNEHISMDSHHDLLEPLPSPPSPPPSALQKAYASMQAQKDSIDKMTGMGKQSREQSLFWDQVPPEVIKNFEAMVQQSANSNTNGIKSTVNMEQPAPLRQNYMSPRS